MSFVSFFSGSVNGLNAGALVKFRGVPTGSVTEMRFPLAKGTSTTPEEPPRSGVAVEARKRVQDQRQWRVHVAVGGNCRALPEAPVGTTRREGGRAAPAEASARVPKPQIPTMFHNNIGPGADP